MTGRRLEEDRKKTGGRPEEEKKEVDPNKTRKSLEEAWKKSGRKTLREP